MKGKAGLRLDLAVVGGDDQLAGLDLVDDAVDLLSHIGRHLVAEGSHADHTVVEAGEGLAAVAAEDVGMPGLLEGFLRLLTNWR